MNTAADHMSSDGRCLFRLHASAVILDRRQRVLLVQEQKPALRGKWNLPGGHVDHGEDVVASAIREAREETGLCCRAKAIVGIYPSRLAVRVVVLVDEWSGEAAAGDEIMAVRWVPPAEALATAPQDMVGNTAQVLRDVLAGRSFPLDVIAAIQRP
jgi:8-oxo-dGTP pyrophosphatase MutT (NUDIX family)